MGSITQKKTTSIVQPTLSIVSGTDVEGLVDATTFFEGSEFTRRGYTEDSDYQTMSMEQCSIYDADNYNAITSTPLVTFECARRWSFYPYIELEPSHNYIIKYRQKGYTGDDEEVWSPWCSLQFTTVSEFHYPTFKFTMITGVQLSALFSFWNAETMTVYRNGVYDETLTTGYSSAQTLSDEGDQIEVVASDNIYPRFQPGNNSTYRSRLISIDAPLPQMRASASDDPLTHFGSNIQYTMFAYCTALTSIPDHMFIYNPQIVYLSCTRTTATSSYTSYTAFSYCTSLETIPEHLLSNLPNLVTGPYSSSGDENIYGWFSACDNLKEVPSRFFSFLYSMIAPCYSTSTGDYDSHVFSYSPSISSTPPELFYNCPKMIIDYHYTPNGNPNRDVPLFAAGSSIITINKAFVKKCPSMIYTGTYQANGPYYGSFTGVTSLTSVDPNCFRYCTNLTTMTRCFYGCTNLSELTLILTAPNITTATNFINSSYTTATIYAPRGSTTASTFSALSGVTVIEYDDVSEADEAVLGNNG